MTVGGARRSLASEPARDQDGVRIHLPIRGKMPREVKTAYEAVQCIKSGDRVVVQGSSATPVSLTQAMTDWGKAAGLKDVKICHLHTEGPAPYTEEDCEGIFHTSCFFVGANMRKAIAAGRAEYVPIYLSEIPNLFRRGILPVDVALVQVSPPDKHGYCSLGTSVDIMRSAVQSAKHVVGQINNRVPRTLGESLVHISQFDSIFREDRDIFEHEAEEPSDVETAIGSLIANNLVGDGATLQMGIGNIPNAVLSGLTHHKDLGIHTEMFSDGVLPLIENGNITNAKKPFYQGKVVTSFCSGTRRLYDFIDDNPAVLFLDVAHVNNTHIISKQHDMVAVNSCIEIDITGQVVSDSIGTRVYSGVGGQVDFLRGASLNHPNGRPILAMPSRTHKGIARIVPTVKEGAGVVTPRALVHWVVTEYGICNLFGKTLEQRARALINIAHPEDRDKLTQEAKQRFRHL